MKVNKNTFKKNYYSFINKNITQEIWEHPIGVFMDKQQKPWQNPQQQPSQRPQQQPGQQQPKQNPHYNPQKQPKR